MCVREREEKKENYLRLIKRVSEKKTETERERDRDRERERREGGGGRGGEQ